MNKKKKRTEGEGEELIKRERNEEDSKALGKLLAWSRIFGGGGYGFYAFHSKLLIANDMYWEVL